MVIERRNDKRYPTPDLESNLSDDNGAYIVVVDDVSNSGVGMTKVPEGFDESVQKCLAVVNASMDDFKLVLHPCWIQTTSENNYKKIGFRIEDPSSEWLEFVQGVRKGAEKENLRSGARHTTQGLMALVSDGKMTFFGVVEDLSEKGLRLSQIPKNFDDTVDTCSVVIQSPTGDVKVSMHPCWIRSAKKGMYKTIGFKISNPPAGWQKMIEDMQKENGTLNFLVMSENKAGLED